MKKIFLFVILLFAFFYGATQPSFQKTIGSPLAEYGFAVKQTSDGGFVICGTQYKDSVNTDIILIKTDALGDTTWIKNYGGSAADYGAQVEETTDGGLIIIGITSSAGAGMSDICLIKTNSAGDTLWTRVYGGTDSELGHSVKQTSDGGYILAGHTDSYGTQGDFYLIKTNASGDTLWTRAYGGIRHDHAFSVAETNDAGYIAVGHSLSFGTLGGFYAVKMNGVGDTVWTRGYGGNGNSFCYSVVQTTDNGYILCGETECFGAGPSEGLVIKINALGDTLWSKTYGGNGSDFFNSVKPGAGGGYILAGYTDSFGAGGTDVLLVKIDENGFTQWAKTYGGAFDDEGDAVNLTTGGGYIMSGSTKSFGAGGYDIYLVKTDSTGLTGCNQGTVSLTEMSQTPAVFNAGSHSFPTASNIGNAQAAAARRTCNFLDVCSANGINETNIELVNYKVYPNPTDNFIVVECDNEIKELKFYDETGNIVFLAKNAAKKHVIDMNLLSNGIYLLRINEQGVKVIKNSH